MTEAGTAYVAVVPNMANFSKQVSAGVGASAGGVKSAATKLGNIFGIALGATAVVAFAKHALAAFDELEVATKRLGFGLAAIGQSGSLQSVVDWAKEFSQQTGIAETTIVGMSSKLSVLGETFFRAMGPQAADFLEKLTQGLTDMSVATGKSAEMLMRSLAPAILNTPLKAIPVLQKLGAITDEQATKIKGLVAAGRLQAATQLEIIDIQTKYNGAAAETSTLTQRLSNYWNQLNISVGKFINTNLISLAQWFGKLNPVLRDVVLSLGAAVAVTTALGIASQLTFVRGMAAAVVGMAGYIAAAASLVVSDGLMATSMLLVSDALLAITLSAAPVIVAIGLVAYSFLAAKANAAKMRKELTDAIAGGDLVNLLSQLADSVSNLDDRMIVGAGFLALLQEKMDKAGMSGTALNVAMTAVGDAIAGNHVTLAQGVKDLEALGLNEGDAVNKANEFASASDNVRQHLSRAGVAVRNFANMTGAEFKSWAASTTTSSQAALGSITDYSHGFGQSMKQVLRGLRLQTERIKRFAADVAVVTSSKLTDQQKAALLAAPNAVVDAWVHGPKSVKAQIIGALEAQGKAADRIQHNINQLNIDPAKKKLSDFAEQWQKLARDPNLDLQINIHAGGGLPPWPGGADNNPATPYPMALGGIVTSPTHILAGEAGPEAIIPLGKRGGMVVRIIDSNLDLVMTGVLQDDHAFTERSGRAQR